MNKRAGSGLFGTFSDWVKAKAPPNNIKDAIEMLVRVQICE